MGGVPKIREHENASGLGVKAGVCERILSARSKQGGRDKPLFCREQRNGGARVDYLDSLESLFTNVKLFSATK
ncbi:hypothetical protein PSEUDO8Z_150023 [Pseudomonas sp. 8Z]|nr:hypothetical protein PSEUDO8Z_150023 [Pseudomonas sp. 8Z]